MKRSAAPCARTVDAQTTFGETSDVMPSGLSELNIPCHMEIQRLEGYICKWADSPSPPHKPAKVVKLHNTANMLMNIYDNLG